MRTAGLLLVLQCGTLAQSREPPSSAVSFPDNHKPINASRICDAPECSCAKRVANCQCRKKALNLTPKLFENQDLVGLRLKGLCLRVNVESEAFYRSSVKWINMEGLGKVILQPNSFRTILDQPQLTVTFRNVEELVMKSHAFSGSILNISIINTTTTSVPDKAFVGTSGDSTVVTFENSTIGTISRHAFMSSRLRSLVFKRCNIGTMEKEAISSDHVASFQLTDSEVRKLQPAAVKLRPQSFDVCRCKFDSVARAAFQVNCSGLVWLHNNTFGSVSDGAFGKISPVGSGARLEFHGNQIQELEPGALHFSAEYSRNQLSVRRLATRQRCRCHLEDWLLLMSGAPDWLREKLTAAVRCRADTEPDIAFVEFKKRCGTDDEQPPPRANWKRIIIAVGIVASMLVAAVCGVTGIIAWRQALRRRREQRDRDRAATDALLHRPHKLNNANLYTDGRGSGGGGGGGVGGWDEREPPRRPPLVVAVPDVKTYTETELHVVLETLESLEPTVLPRLPSTSTLERLRNGPRNPPRRGSEDGEPQSPGCRKSCPL